MYQKQELGGSLHVDGGMSASAPYEKYDAADMLTLRLEHSQLRDDFISNFIEPIDILLREQRRLCDLYHAHNKITIPSISLSLIDTPNKEQIESMVREGYEYVRSTLAVYHSERLCSLRSVQEEGSV